MTINYAATTLGWNVVPTIIAQEKGFFAAEQLTVELNIVGQSATVCQQVLVRAVEIGLCSVNDTIQAIEAGGAPLVIVMQETLSALHNGLMVRPDLTSWADLRGKTIILGGPKDNTVYFFRVMARANGLRDDEYDMIYAGSSSARYAALKAGGADASLLTDPFDYQIEQEGFRRFDNLRPKYISPDNYTGNGPVVRRDWAQSHADVLVRYIRAMLAAIRWINDPANKEEMFAILAPRINLSRETFERSYQRAILIDREWSSDGRARPSAYEGVLKSLVELRVLQEPTPPPTKYFDMTYVERVHRELGR
ncbi:MAG TPA: ABC transporter substrate-binding protein [Chloroflexota bacterium]|nr:ABC transporter substrate-binding protein [Chloroflexota bacterium]